MTSTVIRVIALGVFVITQQASFPLAFIAANKDNNNMIGTQASTTTSTMKTVLREPTSTSSSSSPFSTTAISMVQQDEYGGYGSPSMNYGSGVPPAGSYYGSGGNAGATTTTSTSSTSSTTSSSSGDEEIQQVRVEPDTHEELMYALGVNLARQLGDVRPLVENGEELAQVAKGLLDTVVGRLNDDGQRLLLSKRGLELDDLIMHRANALREKLEIRGREMLKNMQATEGVNVLNTGVCVHVLEAGESGQIGQGSRPTESNVVLIHYHGTLSDGTVFDSTLGGDPVKFPLAQVIPGWRDGVMNMAVGETAMLGIPPEQAYGPMGTPDGRIPGGSTLFFKIQLVEILSPGSDPSMMMMGSTQQYGSDGGQQQQQQDRASQRGGGSGGAGGGYGGNSMY